MRDIQQKVESVIAGETRHGLLPSVLSGLSLLYSGIMQGRALLYERGILQARTLPCPVISVGNLTAGGTGKTPMTIFLADALQRKGYRVAIISRGYRGGAEKTGGIVSDGETLKMNPATAGDEPWMMAKKLKGIPVLVGQNRFASGMRAVRRFAPDVILLDDAFQHLRLNRNINLVLMDSRHPLGNGYVLPRGPLREPVTALKRADAILLTRSDAGPPSAGEWNRLPKGCPVFRTVHWPCIAEIMPRNQESASPPPEVLQGRRVFAFSGIADNGGFQKTIRQLGGILAGSAEFPDHYAYSAQDLTRIDQNARQAGAEFLVTTEKDRVRLSGPQLWSLDLAVIGIGISFPEREDEFLRFVIGNLSGVRH